MPSDDADGTTGDPPTIVSERPVERKDREWVPTHRGASGCSPRPRPGRAAAHHPDRRPVVIATWILYRLLGRLREVILWILIAAFIALVLNPPWSALQRHRFRRGRRSASSSPGVGLFAGCSALFGYPLVNSLTHVAERLPTMVDQVQRGHGWLAHTLKRFGLLRWVQTNAPRLRRRPTTWASRPCRRAPTSARRCLDHPRPHHHRLPVAVHAARGPAAAGQPAGPT